MPLPAVVAVAGDALLDVTINPATPMRHGADVPASVRLGAGGQGANLAVRLARRGVSVRLACAIGDDAAGRLLRDALEAEGIELMAADAETTGAVAIVLDPRGERSMLSQRPPLAGHLDVERLARGAAWLILSGYLLGEPGGAAAAEAAARLRVRRAVLGCAIDAAQAPSWRSALRSSSPQLVVLNRDEACILAAIDGEPAELARRLSAELDACVVVTAPDAANAAAAGLDVSVAGTRITAAVDTTGAGDAFAAALVERVIDARWPPDTDVLKRAMAAAMDAAVEVVGVRGAQGRVASEGAARVPA